MVPSPEHQTDDSPDSDLPADEHSRTREITLHWLKAQPVVEAFVLSMVRNMHATEDIVQQVAVTTVEKFDTWDKDRCAFSTWAVGIAKNKIRNHQRKHFNDRHVFDAEAVDRIADAHAAMQPEVAPMNFALEKCIGKLTGRSRKVIEMRYLRELSTEQVADRLGISRNNVFVILHRVRQSLGDCIKRQLDSERGPS